MTEESLIEGAVYVAQYKEQLANRLESLPLEARKKLLESIRKVIPRPYLSRYCPATLSPKQEAFLCAPQAEILFGGAAGGGKTSALLIGALQYADQPNYNALILRRTFAELEMPRATVSLSKQWLANTDARWRDGKFWQFPSGATLNFGYLARDDDKWQYGSAQYNYIAIDEAAEFPLEDTYTFMFSRIRRESDSKIPGRMRLGANPIGPGATWLKRRFITDQADDRIYIPSKLDDNPYIDKEDYRKSLAKLPPYIRIALENGDWDAKPPGKMFRREWFRSVQYMPQEVIARVRFWDLAATQEDRGKNPSWTCGLRMSYGPDGLFYVENVKRARETPGTIKELVRQTAMGDPLGTEIWIEQEPGSSGIAVIDDYIRFLPRYVVRAFKASGPKETRAAPFAAQAESGNVRMVEGQWNETMLEEYEQFPSTAWKNDQVDAGSGAYNVLCGYVEEQYGMEAMFSVGSRVRPDW